MSNRCEASSEAASVRGALQRAVRFLGAAKVEAPRLTAELLLGHILGWDRERVLSHPEDPVSGEKCDRFVALVERRARGEPLQYLTGVQEFYGLTFRVHPAVLIPRPETEGLVESALRLARSHEWEPIRFIDVGTGSGCIAVAFAREIRSARGWAVDICCDSLALARENAARHQVLDRLHFLCGDVLESFPERPLFEFILSNPPYVSCKASASLPAMVRDHEPHAALFGGDTGLDVLGRLIPQAATRLVPGGYLLCEIGAGMSEEVAGLVVREGLRLEAIDADLQGIPRCVVARRCHG